MFKIVIIILLVIAVGWVGLTVYSCYDRQTAEKWDIPDEDKATHSVYIENTGNLILTNDYEVHGSEPGSRMFIVKGFWELNGQKFTYKDTNIVLDEAIFGVITIKKR